MKHLWTWRLRAHLLALLLVNMVVVFALVGGVVMLWRAPQIGEERRALLAEDIQDVTARLELVLGSAQSRLELAARLVRGRPAAEARGLLDMTVQRSRSFQAMYLVAPDGTIEMSAMHSTLRAQGDDELVGTDLSANALYQAVRTEGRPAWSGKYLSAQSGAVAVGLAVHGADGRVLIGEIALPYVLRVLQAARGQDSTLVWIVDRGGEIIADTENGRHVGRLNLRNSPLLQAAPADGEAPAELSLERQRFHVAVARSDALDWTIMGRALAGRHDPDVRSLVWDVGAMVLACLAMGLLIAPFWAQRLARPLQHIVARAGLATRGEERDAPWPRSVVAEFNALSGDLQAMATALQEREQAFLAIFNASPVPMSVADADRENRIVDVNEAWCRELRRERASVLGRTALDIGLLQAPQREYLLAQWQGGNTGVEVALTRGDGTQMQGQVYMKSLALQSGRLMVWATVNVGPLRLIERELRELNQQLELRVAQRTDALATSNVALSDSVAQLRDTRNELLRAEKMAVLGKLVAGVAHELHSPIGNGIMAIGAMADHVRRFKAAMLGGLKRADLQQMVDGVEQGTDIAVRNLQRAADLVQSFKQVAVDQATSQRRSFELGEVVHEMVVSLRPSFIGTPYRIEVEVPPSGLRLDSYPGALGQAIANLAENAVLHGFDGRGHGTVRLSAERAADGQIVLCVADDGKGIAATLMERIFEPFNIDRSDRGGTGLGLHVAHNAVVNLLGGTLAVHSVEGQGSCFEMRLPAQAPQPVAEAMALQEPMQQEALS